jgi:hypothetical protein
MYTPVLKVRPSELETLVDAQQQSAGLMPLAELTPHSGSGSAAPRGLMSEVLYSFEQLEHGWPSALYVDVRVLAETPSKRCTAWAAVAFYCQQSGTTNAAPVVDLNDDPAVLAAAAKVAALSGQAAVRVFLPTPSPLPGLRSALMAVGTALGLPTSSIHIILDWSDEAQTRKLDDLEKATRSVAGAAGGGWNVVRLLGTAAPANPSGTGFWTYVRREWWLWLRLHHNQTGLPQPVEFGDYAGFPSPNPGSGRATVATLRYSRGDHLHLWRRAAQQSPAVSGFRVCCTDLTAVPGLFSGATFSTGDRCINDVAAGNAYLNGGNAQTWRTAALQHHLALVRAEQAAPPPAPPPGTH